MIKTKFKRTLSLFLCVLMLMGTFPMAALAESGDTVPKEAAEPEVHSHSGGEATCTAQAVCEGCGESYGEVKEHSYGEDGSCSLCGAAKPVPSAEPCAHEYAEGVCTLCGAEEPVPVEETPAVPEAVLAVQALIHALPSVEEVKAMDESAFQEARRQNLAAYGAYMELSAEDQALVTGAEIFDALFAVFNAAAEKVVPRVEYSVIIEPASGGTVTADKSQACAGDAVVLTVSPDEGYELSSLIVLAGDMVMTPAPNEDGTYSFTMPEGDATVSAEFESNNTGNNTGNGVYIIVENPYSTSLFVSGCLTYVPTEHFDDIFVDGSGELALGSAGVDVSVCNEGTISSGIFYNVQNNPGGTINGGSFPGSVSNGGAITGGSFSGSVYNYGIVCGARFLEGAELEGDTDSIGVIHSLDGVDRILTCGELFLNEGRDPGEHKYWTLNGVPVTVEDTVPLCFTEYVLVELPSYEVAIKATGEGTVGIVVDTEAPYVGSANFYPEDMVVFYAAPAKGFFLERINIVADSGDIISWSQMNGKADTYYFNMGEEAVSVEAVFEPKSYYINNQTTDENVLRLEGLPSSTEDIYPDETVTFTPVLTEGYGIDSIIAEYKEDGSDEFAPLELTDNGDGSYSFTMPIGNVRISCTAVETYNIKNGILTVIGRMTLLPAGDYEYIIVDSTGELALGAGSVSLPIVNYGSITSGSYSGEINNYGSISGAKFLSRAKVQGNSPVSVVHALNGVDYALPYGNAEILYYAFEAALSGSGMEIGTLFLGDAMVEDEQVPLIYAQYSNMAYVRGKADLADISLAADGLLVAEGTGTLETYVKIGSEVTLTFTPSESCSVAGITLNGEEVDFETAADGSCVVSFTATKSTNYFNTETALPFGDGWRMYISMGVGKSVVLELSKPFTELPQPGLAYDKIYVLSTASLDLGSALVEKTVTNYGAILSGSFSGYVYNEGTISGGSFNGEVYSLGAVSGGSFSSEFDNRGTITGGDFSGTVENSASGSLVSVISGGNFHGAVNNESGYLPENAIINGGSFYGPVSNTNGIINAAAFMPGASLAEGSSDPIGVIHSVNGVAATLAYGEDLLDELAAYDNSGQWVMDGQPITEGTVVPLICSNITGEYYVNLAETQNGELSVEKLTYLAGSTVTVTAIPELSADIGYELESLTVTAGEETVAATANADGSYSFTMPASNVTVSATFAEADPYVYDGVLYVSSKLTQLPDGDYKTIVVRSTGELALGDTVVKAKVTNNGTVSGGSFSAEFTNNGSISGGSFSNWVFNRAGAVISGGSFSYNVSDYGGTISGGSFHFSVTNLDGTITGGEFYGAINNESSVVGGEFHDDVLNRGSISAARFLGNARLLSGSNDPVSVIHSVNGEDAVLSYGGNLLSELGAVGTGKCWAAGGTPVAEDATVPLICTAYEQQDILYKVSYGFAFPAAEFTAAADGNGYELRLENGVIKVDANQAKYGQTVNIRLIPDETCFVTDFDVYRNMRTYAFEKTGENSYSLTMPDGDICVYPRFSNPTYTVSTRVEGDVHGTVEILNKFNGEYAASAPGESGSRVEIRITPDKGYMVGRVEVVTASGGYVSYMDATKSFTMPSEPVTVIVSFAPRMYNASRVTENVTIQSMDGGYFTGEHDTIRTVFDEHYELDYITAEYMEEGTDEYVPFELTDNGDGSYDFVMPMGDIRITCIGKKIVYPISVKVDGKAWGGVDLGEFADGATFDDEVSFRTFTNGGYGVKSVVVNGEALPLSDSGSYSFTMTGPAEIHAAVEKLWHLSLADSEQGYLTADKSLYFAGEPVSVKVHPADGYHLDSVTVNGEEYEVQDGVLRFTMPEENVTVSASFTEKVYTLSAGYSYAYEMLLSKQGVQPASSLEAVAGETVTITVTPKKNHSVLRVYAEGIEASPVEGDNNTWTVTLPYADRDSLIFYAEVGHSITVTNDRGEVLGHGDTVRPGDVLTVTTTGSNGAEIVQWYNYEADELILTNATYTVNSRDISDGQRLLLMVYSLSDRYASMMFICEENRSYPVEVEIEGQGRVELSKDSYRDGETVEVYLYPEAGYEAEKLEIMGEEFSVSDQPISFELDAEAMPEGVESIVISAKFKAKMLDITLAEDSHPDWGEVSSNVSAARPGDTVTLRVDPAAGFALRRMEISSPPGSDIGSIVVTPDMLSVYGGYSFTMPGHAVHVKYSFVHTPIELTVASREGEFESVTVYTGLNGQISDGDYSALEAYFKRPGHIFAGLELTDSYGNVSEIDRTYGFTEAPSSPLYVIWEEVDSSIGVSRDGQHLAEGAAVYVGDKLAAHYSGFSGKVYPVWEDASGNALGAGDEFTVPAELSAEENGIVFALYDSDGYEVARWSLAYRPCARTETEQYPVLVRVNNTLCVITPSVRLAGEGERVYFGLDMPEGYRLAKLDVSLPGSSLTLEEATGSALSAPDADGEYSFVMPAAPVEIYAEITDGYLITVEYADENGSVSVDYFAAAGEQVRITPYPDEGYRFSATCTGVSNGVSLAVELLGDEVNCYGFTMPEQDVLITVAFEEIESLQTYLYSENYGLLGTFESREEPYTIPFSVYADTLTAYTPGADVFYEWTDSNGSESNGESYYAAVGGHTLLAYRFADNGDRENLSEIHFTVVDEPYIVFTVDGEEAFEFTDGNVIIPVVYNGDGKYEFSWPGQVAGDSYTVPANTFNEDDDFFVTAVNKYNEDGSLRPESEWSPPVTIRLEYVRPEIDISVSANGELLDFSGTDLPYVYDGDELLASHNGGEGLSIAWMDGFGAILSEGESYTVDPADLVAGGSIDIELYDESGELVGLARVKYAGAARPAEGKYAIAVRYHEDTPCTVSAPDSAAPGKTVSIRPELADGWRLAKISVRKQSGEGKAELELTANSNGSYSFVMPEDNVIIVPAFSDGYRISYADAENGTLGGVDGIEYAAAGEKVFFKAKPAVAYRVKSVGVAAASEAVSVEGPHADGSYSFTMPASDVTVSAEFEPVAAEADVTVTVGNTSTGAFLNHGDSVMEGDWLYVRVEGPNADGYWFRWVDNNGEIWFGPVCEVPYGIASVELSVYEGSEPWNGEPDGEPCESFTFPVDERSVHALGISSGENGTASFYGVHANGAAYFGDIVSLDWVPNADYVVGEVTVTGESGKTYPVSRVYESDYDYPESITFTMPDEDVTVSVGFRKEIKHRIAVSALAVMDKVYDGSAAASVKDGYGVTGLPADFSLLLSAAFADGDAGFAKPVTVAAKVLDADGFDISDICAVTGLDNVTANIGRRELAFAINNQSKIYGEEDPAISVRFTKGDLVARDEEAFYGALSREAGEDVGEYTIRLDQQVASLERNYILSVENGKLTVQPRPLTVTASKNSKYYGEADPVLQYTVEGLMEGDSLIGELSRESGEDVGSYPIGIGTLAAPNNNYVLDKYIGADFTVSPKRIYILCEGATKTYGDPDPEFTYTTTGTLVGEDRFSGSLEREAGEDVGMYFIAEGSFTAGPNYKFTVVPGMLVVAAREISVSSAEIAPLLYNESGEYTMTLNSLSFDNLAFDDSPAYTCELAFKDGWQNKLGSQPVTVTVTLGENEKNYVLTESSFETTVVIAEHSHDWRFSANGAEITATCQSTFGVCPVGTATLRLEAPADLVYDGSEKAVTVAGSIDGVTPEIVYSGDRENVTAEGFTASVTLGEATASLTVKLEKAVIGIDDISLEVTAPVVGAVPQSSLIPGDGFSANIAWAPAAGTFAYNTVYKAVCVLTADNNHVFDAALDGAELNGFALSLGQDGVLNGSKTFDATVKAKLLSLTAPSVPGNAFTGHYADGAAACAALPGTVTYGSEAGEVTVAVEWSVDAYSTAVEAYNTFVWTVAEGQLDNYNINNQPVTGSCAVKNAPALPVTHTGVDTELGYDGQPIDVSRLFERDANAGAASYAIVSGGTGDGTITDGKLEVLRAGTFVIKLTTEASGIYAAGEATATLTVNKGQGYGSVSIADWVYGDDAAVPVVTGSAEPLSSGYRYTGNGYDSAAAPKAAGEYTLTVTIPESALYTATTISTTFAIAPRAIRVTADAVSKVYGEADPKLTYMVSGLVGSDTLGGALSRAAGETVGTYAIEQGTLFNDNYSIEYVAAELEITPKTITVTAEAKSKVYGEANPELTYKVSGLVGSDTLGGALSRAAGETVGTYAIEPGTLGNANYTIAFAGAELEITPKAITVTADAVSKVYGNTDPALTYKAEGLVGSDTLSGALSRAAGETVGTYSIEQGTLANANYTIAFIGAELEIKPKTITVTADAVSKVYGDADPALTYKAEGLVGSDTLSGALSRAAGETVGTYAIEQGTLANANYTIGFTGAELEITPKAITVTADAVSKVYGDTDPALTYKAEGLVGSDALSGALSRAAGETVGTYAIEQGTLANANYTIGFTGAELEIMPKAITVTADAVSKVYGAADPELTYKVSGLVGSDTLSGALSRAAGETVGTYAIEQGTLANANYTIGFTGAELEIMPKTITVTADAVSKVYGDADPALTYKVSGLVGSDTLSGALSRTAGETVGAYSIELGTLGNANYTIAFTGAELEITPKTITVTADAVSKVYGAADPELTYKVSGLVGSDALSGALSRAAGETVGTYAIEQGTLANANYTIAFTSAELKITPKTITVTADAVSKVYGAADPELTYKVSGLLGSDTLSGKLSRAQGENIGSYAIGLGTLGNPNYSIRFTGAALSIQRRPITAADVALRGTLSYTGTEQTQRVTVTNGITYSVTGNRAVDVGSYRLTVTGTGNYCGSISLWWKIGAPAILEDVVSGKVNADNATLEQLDELKLLDKALDSVDKDTTGSDREKQDWESGKEKLSSILEGLEAASDLLNSGDVQDAADITEQNVTVGDRAALEAAKADLEELLSSHAGKLGEKSKADAEARMERIEKALAALDGAGDLIEEIKAWLAKNDALFSADQLELRDEYRRFEDEINALDENTGRIVKDAVGAGFEAAGEKLYGYKITHGDGSTWTGGSKEGLSFTANGSHSLFTELLVDGEAVDGENYTVEAGSTVVTLAPDWLKTLEPGEHSIRFVYTDGSSDEGFFRVLPGSGGFGTALWILLAALSATGAGFAAFRFKRKKSYR